MTEIDWIIIAVLALSTIVGIMRGVLREVLAIAGWVAGIFLAMNYSAVVAEHIPLESIGWLPRVIIAAVLIVVACLFVVGLLSAIIRRLLETAALRFEDRALGAVFGFLRQDAQLIADRLVADAQNARHTRPGDVRIQHPGDFPAPRRFAREQTRHQ